MSDWVKVPEADWELLQSMKETLRARALEKGLGEIQAILLRRGFDPGQTLEEISGEMRTIKTTQDRVFGRLNRHNCRMQLSAMLRLNLFSSQEIEAFTRGTRLWAEKVLADQRGETPEPVAAVCAPGKGERSQAEEKLDGFITPDGEYVRLDDLGAMEGALRRQFGGDEQEVLKALRGMALGLARERRDEAARRFLDRARELGAGAATEGNEMLRLGLAFEGIRRFDLAGECYAYGRSLGEGDLVPWYFLHNNHAYCLAMLERFAEAEVLARQAIDIEPGRHNAHKNLGLALMGQGRLQEAAESFRRARDLNPGDGRAAYYLEILDQQPGRPCVQQTGRG